MKGIKLSHDRIARRLRNHRRGGDAGGQRVAFDDAALRCLTMWNAPRINQNEIRLRRQPFNGAPHCQKARVIDVQRVDLFNFRAANCPDDCVLLDLFS